MRRVFSRRVLAAALSLAVGGGFLGVVQVAAAPTAGSAAVSHRILITGDSITHGSNGDFTWRYRLVKKLQTTAPGSFQMVGPDTRLFDHITNTHGSTNYADPNFTGKEHAARWGTTFIQQLPNIAQQVTASNANTLVVMLGSNDLAFQTSPQETVANLRTYIQRARTARPGIDVVVGEVVTRWDPWTSSLVLESQAAEYKTRIAALASSMNTSSERVVVANTLNGWDPVNHTWDGTHPNAAGETLIAQRVSEGLAKLGLGAASPNVYDPHARWTMRAPAPTVAVGTEKATLSWSLNSTGATGMFLSYHLDMPGQDWVELPYPVGSNYGNQWTMEPLAGGASYDFALRATKGFMASDRMSPVVSRAIPGITPGAPRNIQATVVPDDPTWGHQVKVAWKPGSNAQGYMLSSRTFPHPAGARYEELPYPVTDTSWTFGWLESGRRYRFRVASVRGFLSSVPAMSGQVRSRGIPESPTYAVMGDSYSSGNGRWGALERDKYYDQECMRTLAGWSSHVLEMYTPSRLIVACSGAKIDDIQSQIDMVERQFLGRPDSAQLITISVGGNDVGFKNALIQCLFLDCADQDYQEDVLGRISLTGGRLDSLYAQLRREFKYSDIVAVGYPSPIGRVDMGEWLTCHKVVTPEEEEFISLATRRFNAEISSSASWAGVWGEVGRTIFNEFWTHGGCSEDNWIHAFQAPLTSNSFHQNPAGHFQYGRIMNEYLAQRMG